MFEFVNDAWNRRAQEQHLTVPFSFQSYMEDHLKNKNRLEKEWEALCTYQAEPNAATIARKAENAQKNRSQEVLACTCGWSGTLLPLSTADKDLVILS